MEGVTMHGVGDGHRFGMLPVGILLPWCSGLSSIWKFYLGLSAAHVVTKVVTGVLRRWRRARLLRDTPHVRARSHPLLGSVPDMVANQKRLHHWRDESSMGLPVSKFLGPIWDPDVVHLFVRDPEGIRHFLKSSSDKYTKMDAGSDWLMKHLVEFLGDGIFTTKHGIGAPDSGARWWLQRKIAAGIFSHANFNNNMHAVFVAKAKCLREYLEPGQAADIQLHFFNYTMDSVMHIFFGEQSDSLGGVPNAYGQAFDSAHRSFMEYTIGSMALGSLVKLLPWPFGGFSGLGVWLHHRLSPSYRDFRGNCAILDRECEQIIARCQQDPALSKRSDLLALFMQAVQREQVPMQEQSQYLRDTVMNFVIAGRDTTACTLSWVFYMLATQPEIQRRVAEEVDRQLPGDMEPTLRLVHHSRMPLLHALLYESFRLYPPVPWDLKEAQCDDTLPDGTRVPKGAVLSFLPWAMGRDPKVYPEPEEVRLERWIPFKQPPPHEFPVFQAGPRICLGMDMAIFEAKILVAMLLQRFSFSLAPRGTEEIHYGNALTMAVCNSRDQDSHSLWLVPERRHRSAEA
mmetsp:Transcript_4080/g.12716  ORF Transcript_4080/g.12716 Transcript_4080/m.12716 type:complete len:570 (-) Transcript_4080:93-1802(-)